MASWRACSLHLDPAKSLCSEEVCGQAARLLDLDRTGLDLQAAITGQFQSMLREAKSPKTVGASGGIFYVR
jgi:hypothetical protein